MAQGDQTQKCSNSSSGGGGGIGGVSRSSSRKPKQTKVPQRGLGVAQLEKIRLEEQQKKDAATILPSQCSISPTKSSYLSLPIPNFHHPDQSSSSIPFPSPSPSGLSPPDSLIKLPPMPVQNIDDKNSTTVPLPNPVNSGCFEAGWATNSVPLHGNVPKLWIPNEYEFEKENCGIDPGLAFRSNMSLPYESNPIWPLPNLTQRTQHQQSSSMVNVSLGTSSTSLLHYPMEPPSNQNYCSSYMTMWPEEEKMVGMKRPYPLSLDNPSGRSFNYKLPAFVAPMRSDQAASWGNGGTFNFDNGNSTFSEGPSCSTSISEPNSKKSNEENGVCCGDFLTLAPPRTTSLCPYSKSKHPSMLLEFHNHEYPDFESLPFQGSVEDPVLQPGPSRFNQQQPFYSFFPPETKAKFDSTTVSVKTFSEAGESVDLNLKL
ncbi:Actin cytoskeleton-regulatory complex protein pan1, putative isoform 1 [Quillaja saponaria]|uniref:Actin cytoskeleton-regulatory complex protein pan1, putative isoform 1 n=1 Tax=Quillaja saponaria TaxID=32244 RepID=A0AAD7PAV8_QUISA|nr:Actin cytoskeleton-regulatory complex protein pan1, putative isoform 1 [Quillaja saponaria]